MGQKVNPIANRLGYIRGWDSNWYANKATFPDKLIEDEKIRHYLHVRVTKAGIARIVIERTLNRIIVTIHTSRPGIIIGKGGSEVDLIKEELKKLTKTEVQVNIKEIRRPELDANIVAETVAKQLEARINFRRAVKMAISNTMRAGAEGIKIRVSGRLGGAEMARVEEYKEGRTPLHTFRAEIDYALKEAHTVYGKIGVKVWICKGEKFGKVDLSPEQPERNSGNRGDRGNKRSGGRRGGSRRRS